MIPISHAEATTQSDPAASCESSHIVDSFGVAWGVVDDRSSTHSQGPRHHGERSQFYTTMFSKKQPIAIHHITQTSALSIHRFASNKNRKVREWRLPLRYGAFHARPSPPNLSFSRLLELVAWSFRHVRRAVRPTELVQTWQEQVVWHLLDEETL